MLTSLVEGLFSALVPGGQPLQTSKRLPCARTIYYDGSARSADFVPLGDTNPLAVGRSGGAPSSDLTATFSPEGEKDMIFLSPRPCGGEGEGVLFSVGSFQLALQAKPPHPA